MSLADQLGFRFEIPARRVWTVADLIGAVRTQLERQYTDVWVEGEISNFRPAESGHLYFTLKDDGAQLRIVMFRTQARLLRFRPENGMQVLARGRVTVYEGRGELQLSAEYLEPKGAGALQVAFEQLKAKLAAEGLFDQSRKKPVPGLPRTIGIVTSPRGAALQDILNILQRRHETVGVLIYPAQVQGPAAASEVASGIRFFNKSAPTSERGSKQPASVDVIIVARGGGSLEDLAAFNDEGLARVIAASQIPVISAVGHETDFTICDFVADLRAPTPSAAAELVIRSKHEIEQRVADLQSRLARAARYRLLMARNTLAELAQHAAFSRFRDLLNRRQQRLDDIAFRLAAAERDRLLRYRRRYESVWARLNENAPRRSLQRLQRDLDARSVALANVMRTLLARRSAQIHESAARLEGLSPLKVLERGYALVFDASGELIKSAEQVKVGDEITAKLARGIIAAKVHHKR
jgi:exodeoxyribonuclease VII large subunit